MASPPTRPEACTSSPATARWMQTPAAVTTATRSSGSRPAEPSRTTSPRATKRPCPARISISDLGGVLLLPDQGGAHPHEMVSAGKGGTVYLVDRDNMGGFNADSDQIVQELVNIFP